MSDLKETIDLNYRAVLLLGMGTSLIMECKNYLPRSEHYKIDWFLDAINSVIYEKKSIPPFPVKALL